MRSQTTWLHPGSGFERAMMALSVSLLFLASFVAHAANLSGLSVVGVAPDGSEAPVDAYRWLVERDLNYHVPTLGGGPQPDANTLSVGFHRSHMPVVAKGCVGFVDLIGPDFPCNEVPAVLQPNAHYYVSVVPRAGGSVGGASFETDEAGNPLPVSVYVNQHPIQTAQISVLIFHDNAPINNAPDLPREEPGTGPGQTDMSGFQIIVEDAGGRYGASAGVQSQDAFGNPLGTTYAPNCDPYTQDCVTGFQPLITGPDGRLTIKNLAPGKYGISAVPPVGTDWQQTATIEGTKIIDAWVKAGEPPYFAEFGPPGFHVFIGYVQPFDDIPAGGGATLSGTVVNQHLSRPPDYAFYNGACFPHTTPWVGLNDMATGIGEGVYAMPTDEDCHFSIPNVPDGNYQLVIWDNNLDLIFAFKGVTITNGQCSTPNGSCDFGEVPVFQWFHRQEHFVYNDVNADGMWGPDEVSINDQAVLLRWRDGTVYQENVTDFTGAYAFDQVFPFFSWLVAEVDFARFQATGLQVVVDDGGPIDLNDPWTFDGLLNPQDQTNPSDPDCMGLGAPCAETATDRIDLGPVLTAGFQGFIGQTHVFQWGKRHYADGENGGISGIVFYATTRAENNPELAGAEPWEPGIPGVTVNLYGLGPDALPNTADDVLLNTTVTDSWDDAQPTGCKWGNGTAGPFVFDPDGPTGPIPPANTDCYDGLRNFGQVRPAVFDGGYAFDAVCEGGVANCPDEDSANWVSPMPIGDYVVEVVAPPGYEILKPEDQNVGFGDQYVPAPELLPPPCVGDLHTVPDYLTLFPDAQEPAPFAGQEVSLCDKKRVTLASGANAAADFFLFTEVPIAAHGLGFILDDTQNEFDPNSPNFGEKYAPPFVPVSIRDFSGRMIGKTMSDQYGRYNFLAPSTITANLPQPSGMSPNMLTTCMNDPGDDPNNPDPNWNQQYSTFCYTFQYMPGTTTYLDTPVIPVAAFTGPDQFPLDCEYPDGAPRIYSAEVDNGVGGGPYIPTTGIANNLQTSGERILTITSMEQEMVQNPNYCNAAAGACPTGADTLNKFITRDHGFGAQPGTVTLGDLGTLNCPTWSDAVISCTIPANTPVNGVGGRQLTVTRANGQSTEAGVTVQVGLRQNANVVVIGPPATASPLEHTIQDAIDLAGANDLILVRPGTYSELVVMWKPVQLMGFGEGSTVINAIKAPTEKLQVWRAVVDGLIANGSVDLLPGQEIGPGDPEPVTLWNEEGAGVLVLAKASGQSGFGQPLNRQARVANFTIRGADTGGGIIANGYADYLELASNRIANNSGVYGGGIRIGHPQLTMEAPDGGVAYTDADNDFVSVRNNQVVFNGGLGGAGGGISMYTGADGYRVTQNWVCGNFSQGEGGGIAHYGRSDGAWALGPGNGNNRPWILNNVPLIEDNTVIFNETFYQQETVSGGGLFIGGAVPLGIGGLSPGAGNVQVVSNLVLGNSAGAGDGGGIRLARVNGADVAANPADTPRRNGNQGQNDPAPWHRVDVFNNMIVDNVAALAGGGLSLQDAVGARIVHNTIANNDSLGVAGEAFAPGSPNQSTPQPGAGLVSRSHSAVLAGASASVGGHSVPLAFADNIVWHNRQFSFFVDTTSGCVPGDPSCTSTYGLCPDVTGNTLNCPGGNAVVYDDLAVIGAVGALPCTNCIVSDDGDPDPLFVAEYANGGASAVFQPEVTTAIQTPVAFDEGGNFIRPRFGPLALYDDPTSNDGDPGSLFGDYHLQPGSPAINAGLDFGGTYSALIEDIDDDMRPVNSVDIGADEAQ